ncbi:hypothetical protein PANDA_013802 [Ailuropoda melanoleuca]|uniref:Uncharacterized protein n=1 Tax=Ailuropoda melanoleuca TaxID=9646 RepID=D2HPR8_AILME|nr:hypothetical protein PANDA_013802 [Ailuropoda melanoleuca]
MLRRVCWPRGRHARKVSQGLPVSAHLGLSGHWQDVTQYKESSVLDEIKPSAPCTTALAAHTHLDVRSLGLLLTADVPMVGGPQKPQAGVASGCIQRCRCRERSAPDLGPLTCHSGCSLAASSADSWPARSTRSLSSAALQLLTDAFSSKRTLKAVTLDPCAAGIGASSYWLGGSESLREAGVTWRFDRADGRWPFETLAAGATQALGEGPATPVLTYGTLAPRRELGDPILLFPTPPGGHLLPSAWTPAADLRAGPGVPGAEDAGVQSRVPATWTTCPATILLGYVRLPQGREQPHAAPQSRRGHLEGLPTSGQTSDPSTHPHGLRVGAVAVGLAPRGSCLVLPGWGYRPGPRFPTGPEHPTENPTENPTEHPTEIPTENPTEHPTENPTEHPTEIPTEHPTEIPTEHPTEIPTEIPTELRTWESLRGDWAPIDTEVWAQGQPTEHPAEHPTEIPAEHPAEHPTEIPTEHPTKHPTEHPTEIPTEIPTELRPLHQDRTGIYAPQPHPSLTPWTQPPVHTTVLSTAPACETETHPGTGPHSLSRLGNICGSPAVVA